MIDTSAVFSHLRAQVPADNGVPFTVNWRIPDDLPYLNGHFPDNPIFPAVGIVDASLAMVEAYEGMPKNLMAISNAKFMHPMSPGLTVQIEVLRLGENEWKILWRSAPPAENMEMAWLSLMLTNREGPL